MSFRPQNPYEYLVQFMGQAVNDLKTSVAQRNAQADQRAQQQQDFEQNLKVQQGQSAQDYAFKMQQTVADLIGKLGDTDPELTSALSQLSGQLGKGVLADPREAQRIIMNARATLTRSTRGAQQVPQNNGQGGLGSPQIAMGTNTTAQSLGAQDLIGRALGEATKVEADKQAKDFAMNTLVPILSRGDVDPTVRQRVIAQVFQQNPDAFDPITRSTLMAVGGWVDEAAMRKSIAEADTAQAAAGQAQVQLDIATQSKDDIIKTYAADRALKESEVRVAQGTEPAKISLATLSVDEARQTLYLNYRKYLDEHSLTRAQVAQITQAVQEQDVTFNQEVRTADANAVEAAYQSGFDGSLSDKQKAMLAAYISHTLSFPTKPGDEHYVKFLDGQAHDGQVRMNAETQGAVLDLAAKRAGIDQTEAQTKILRQNFDINQYDFAHKQGLDALNDSTEVSTKVFDAAQAGDTALIDTYINFLSNPDIYAAQAKKLTDFGFTVAGLGIMRNAAAQTKQLNLATDQEKLNLLVQQGRNLVGQDMAQRYTILSSIADMVPDPSFVDRYATQLQQDGRWTQEDINIFKSMASGKVIEAQVGDAAKEMSALSSGDTVPTNAESWRIAYVSAAVRAHVPQATAESLADAFLASWQHGDSKFDQDLLHTRAQAALYNAQAQYYLAQADATKNPPFDLTQAADAQRQFLANAQTSTFNSMSSEGCLPPSIVSLSDLTGQYGAQLMGMPSTSDSPTCAQLRHRMEAIGTAQLANGGVSDLLAPYTPGAVVGDATGAAAGAAPPRRRRPYRPGLALNSTSGVRMLLCPRRPLSRCVADRTSQPFRALLIVVGRVTKLLRVKS